MNSSRETNQKKCTKTYIISRFLLMQKYFLHCVNAHEDSLDMIGLGRAEPSMNWIGYQKKGLSRALEGETN